jgi:hypothetical protein
MHLTNEGSKRHIGLRHASTRPQAGCNACSGAVLPYLLHGTKRKGRGDGTIPLPRL